MRITRAWKIVFWSAGGVIAAFFAVVGYCVWLLSRPAQLPADAQSLEVLIAPNMSIRDVVELLAAKNALSSPAAANIAARLYARYTGRGIQRGVYEIKAGMTQFEAIALFFSRANVQTVSVTFQEGLTLRRYAGLAAEKIGCGEAEFLRLAYADSLRKARGVEAASLEGYFMPNTYEFYKRSSAAEIIDKLLAEQEEFWQKECAAKAQERGMTRHEALTLASIVEAETPVNSEKKRVSGVYSNRLKLGMKLEADPTVQYALDRINPRRSSRRLLYGDLNVESAYNTYKNFGLPPAPINSPGKTALLAALEPEHHKFYYFVAAADGSNTHIFSRTGEEHQRAVALYRSRRAKAARSKS